EIETRQKWLGAFYAQEIQRGSIPDLTIAWINFDIGYGVIANCDLPKQAYIGEYTGIVRKRRYFSDKKNGYCFEYSIGETIKSPFIIDAKPKGNHTRFINHSDNPNLEPACVLSGGLMHIILFAIKPIPKGTQLSYDYGEDYWAKRQRIKRAI
ncbi:MAG TPA: SET domain-containing protein-lysine N-methyltransferase, partial [Rhabdochlamydiaceae bacterium]|nr:SET domain-containing protein-lysine N-methyltransferase [Rhabdochlamydiaceae bacterium]